jgi:hypothetical protein
VRRVCYLPRCARTESYLRTFPLRRRTTIPSVTGARLPIARHQRRRAAPSAASRCYAALRSR